MLIEEFKLSLKQITPPDGLSDLLKALWWDAKNDWDQAHHIAQDVHSKNAAWVHAYLHRKDGDLGNAGYWYSRAGKTKSSQSLKEEWDQIARTLLV